MEPGSRRAAGGDQPGSGAETSWSGALGGLLDRRVPVNDKPGDKLPDGAVIVGTRDSSKAVQAARPRRTLWLRPATRATSSVLSAVGHRRFTVIAGNTEVGALYGTFAFLRLMQTQRSIRNLDVSEAPRIKNRHLNNWEATRLYAGNDAAGTGGLNGENGTIFNFAATGASAARNLPVILDRYIVVGAGAGVRRDQRLRDQPGQRRQRLPDAGVHRAGGGAGRRAAPLRDQDLPGDQLHGADRQPVRAGHADQRAARSLRAPRSGAGGPARPSSCRRRSRTSWASPSRPTPKASRARRTSATTTATAPTASRRRWRRWA